MTFFVRCDLRFCRLLTDHLHSLSKHISDFVNSSLMLIAHTDLWNVNLPETGQLCFCCSSHWKIRKCKWDIVFKWGRPVLASPPIQHFILSKKKTASLKDPVRKTATDSMTEDLINISACAVVCGTVGKTGPKSQRCQDFHSAWIKLNI